MQRWKAQIAVEILERHHRTTLVTDSVFERGLFVRTDAPPSPMTLLRMQLALPSDDTRLVVHGMVANTVQPYGTHSVPGIEVAFFASAGESQRTWSRFIEHLRTAHPESLYRPVMLARELADATERYAFVEDLRPTDLSPKGMFLATPQPFSVGSDVRITLTERASSSHRTINGVVRRRVAGQRNGIGVEYSNLSDDTWRWMSERAQSSDSERALQAEVLVVRAPVVPLMMETLSGPWSAEGAAEIEEDRWSLPPENGWS